MAGAADAAGAASIFCERRKLLILSAFCIIYWEIAGAQRRFMARTR